MTSRWATYALIVPNGRGGLSVECPARGDSVTIMSAEHAGGAAARFAFAQLLGRVYDRTLAGGWEAVITAIAQRPDSMEKLQRFQALQILNHRIETFAEHHGEDEVAGSARVLVVLSRLCAKKVWTRLKYEPVAPVPTPDETAVLVAFMADKELMDALGVDTANVKQIDAGIDMTPTGETLDL